MHPVLFHVGAFVIPSYGALAAIGVLVALTLALYTARRLQLDPNKIWNLCIIVLFTALIGSRLLLIVANWSTMRHHPMWILGLAMIHNPVLAAIGILAALAAALFYGIGHHLPFRTTSDVLAPPIALAIAFEQLGALLAGSGYGTGTNLPWAIRYTDPLAERWSGAPLDIPVHPVQAYAAICFLLIALALLFLLPRRRQNGDLAGIFLMAAGVVLYITEFWRDPIGRGAIFRGFLKAPQAAGIVMLLAGALLLLERKSERVVAPSASVEPAPPSPHPEGQTHG